MLSSGLIFADAVGEFLDWIVPVVFFVIFFLSVASSAKKKAKEASRRVQRNSTSAVRPTPSFRREYPRANGADAVLELLKREINDSEKPAEVLGAELENEREEKFDVIEAAEFGVGEGESHVTPMGEPYRSSLAGATAPSVEHSEGHIGAEMPEGTVAPPPPGATVKAGAKITVRRAHASGTALPRLRLVRGKTALRSAIVLREVLSRPRAYDI